MAFRYRFMGPHGNVYGGRRKKNPLKQMLWEMEWDILVEFEWPNNGIYWSIQTRSIKCVRSFVGTRASAKRKHTNVDEWMWLFFVRLYCLQRDQWRAGSRLENEKNVPSMGRSSDATIPVRLSAFGFDLADSGMNHLIIEILLIN